MGNSSDEKYMQYALKLASKARGRTSPNPLVGALIVKDEQIIGEGYHQKAGSNHAEINALNMAGLGAKGAKMYVTLEPCSHYGRTPPCVDAIISAGISEVIIATLDPNPQIMGEGIRKLNAAGITTKVGVLEKAALKLNEVFCKYITTKMPFVLMKYAMTLDGKIATSTGDSQWISSEDSRKLVHYWRNSYDAILVGIGTVLADNPTLNTRLDILDKKNPIRIILDDQLAMPLNSNIVNTSQEQETIIFTAKNYDKNKANLLREKGLKIIGVSGGLKQLDLKEVLAKLGELNITSVLVEGGANVNASFIENRLVDKISAFVAPKIVGGIAPSPITGQGVKLMQDAHTFNDVEVETIADDVLITLYTGW